MAHGFDVFFSYSHRDDDLRIALETHLAVLKREERIRTWHDRELVPGDDWAGEIDRNLDTAHLILLLISPDFLASDYCYDREMTRALERHAAGEVVVVPIILRPCDWQSAPFGTIQGLPKDARPITRWDDRDEAFLDVTRGLRRLLGKLQAKHERALDVEPDLLLRPEAPTPIRGRHEFSPGEERVHARDGSVLVFVPGGNYTLGTETLVNSKPVHRIELSPFWIGKYPVTNEQYAQFLEESDHREPEYWADKRFNAPRQPVVGVSWHDARAYCDWAGLALPCEAQWEAAARGTDGRPFPWGRQKLSKSLADFGQDWASGRPMLVGKHPSGAGPYGAENQAGTVWEWCQDRWRPEAYINSDGAGHRDFNAKASDIRVLCGGSWDGPADNLPAAVRGRNLVEGRDQDLGFRVVSIQPTSTK